MSDMTKSYQWLFAELKRRRVFRVMAIYGAVGFVLLQVADLLGEGLRLPEYFLPMVTALVLIGFPIAIVLAWAFEQTPDGVRRTERAEPEEIEAIVAQPASKRLPAGLLALAGIVLLFGAWWMGRQGSGPEMNLSVPEAQASEFQRIAVLPFEDLGGNAEGDPFLAGLHEDIRGKLANLADLRVTSLESVRDYGGLDRDVRQVASDLGNIDYLLRGSVRRSGDVARVNVWLIDASTSEDIWFEQWDRQVTVENLFAIQSQIARQVADQLQASLTPADIEQLEASLSTADPAALNAYYRVRAAWNTATWHDADEVLSQAERVVELAPEFVEGWSLLANILSSFAAAGGGYPGRALEAVQRTESLAPGSLEAVKARARYQLRVEGDLQRALELFRTAESKAPSDVEILTNIAFLQSRLGDALEGAQTMKRAVFLDPRNSRPHLSLAAMLQSMSMWDAADAVIERALAIDPTSERAQRLKLWLIVQGDGDPRRALGLAAEFGLEPDWGMAWVATLDRDFDAAVRMLEGLSSPDDEDGSLRRLNEMFRLNLLSDAELARGGDPGPALDSLSVLVTENGTKWEDLQLLGQLQVAEALVFTGRQEEGWALLEKALDDARSSEDQAERVFGFWWAARINAQFDRREEALALLDQAVGKPSSNVWSLADLNLDPKFDSIRDDPRFDALIARQRAYEEEQARLAEELGPWLP